MKIFSVVLFFFITLTANTQEVVKDFYLKKSLKQEGLQYQFTVLDEGKRGVWHYQRSKFYFWYKAQKVMSTQGGASGQLLNGNFEAFHENKQLAQKGKFCRGLKDGQWLYWRTDGTLRLMEDWKKGEFTGQQVVYDEHGDVEQEIHYGIFRSKIYKGDSIFVIQRKYGKGEVESWKMDEGSWRLDDGRGKMDDDRRASKDSGGEKNNSFWEKLKFWKKGDVKTEKENSQKKDKLPKSKEKTKKD